MCFYWTDMGEGQTKALWKQSYGVKAKAKNLFIKETLSCASKTLLSSVWGCFWQVAMGAKAAGEAKIGHNATNHDSPLRLMESGVSAGQMMVDAMEQSTHGNLIRLVQCVASRAWTLARFHNHGNRNPLAPEEGGVPPGKQAPRTHSSWTRLHISALRL